MFVSLDKITIPVDEADSDIKAGKTNHFTAWSIWMETNLFIVKYDLLQ